MRCVFRRVTLGLWFIAVAVASATSVLAEFRYLHNKSADRLIIFVHGLEGGAVDTFSAPRPALPWPELMASDRDNRAGDRPLSEHAIAVLGYPGGATDSLSIPEVAKRLLAELENNNITSSHREIIFITHSLGGLVVKRMLIGESVGSRSRLSLATKLVFLLASPAGGSAMAEWASNPVVSRYFGGRIVSDLRRRETNSLIQSIQTDWDRIAKLPVTQRPYIACAYETKPMGGVAFVVPPDRADQQCDQRVPINDADHSTIVKPASRKHDIYTWTAEVIAAYSKHRPNSEASHAVQPNAAPPAGSAAPGGARGPVPRAAIYAEQFKHFKTAIRDHDSEYLDHLKRDGFRLRAGDLCSEMEAGLYRWTKSGNEVDLATLEKLSNFSNGERTCQIQKLGNDESIQLDHWLLEHVVEKVLFSCSKRSEAPLYIKAIDRIIASQRASPAFRDAARNYVAIPQQMRELTPQRIVEVCSDALLNMKGEQSHLRGAILRCLFPMSEGANQSHNFLMTVFTRLSSRPDSEKQIKAEVAGYQCKSLVKRVAFDGASFEPALARWSK